ncbi:MAG: hypothetical protein ACOY33_09740 [Pseudomonadota bacterium]
MRTTAFLFALYLLPVTVVAGDTTVVVVTQRLAGELLPILQPLAGSDVSVQVFGGRLVLGGPAGRVAGLRAVIAELDRPLRNLRISVRRHDVAASAQSHIRAQWESGQGVRVGMAHDQQHLQSGDIRQLVLLEGTTARLSVDREIPVLMPAPLNSGILPSGNGIDLAAQAAGDGIRLEVRRRDAQVDGGAIAAQTVQSVLLLVPGEWTELGAVVAGQATRWDVRIDYAD